MSPAWHWLPGSGHWRAGRRAASALLALAWLAIAALWVWRGGALAPALLRPRQGGMCTAAWTALVLLAGLWLLGTRTGPARPWRGLVTSRRDAAVAWASMAVLAVALLAPALTPHDPHEIGAGVASHNLPPLARLWLIETRDGATIAASEVELDGDRVRILRRDRWTTMARAELLGNRPGDWLSRRWHLLGTDHLGRDLLSRILVGSRVSLGVGLLAALLAALLGAALGGLAGWAGPRVDGMLMRLTDVVLAFPRLFLVLLVLTVVPGSFLAVVIVLGATGWMTPCRLVRAQVLSLRERDFVQAARVAGQRHAGIIWRHLLPNALGPLLVATTLRVGDTILIEAGLSFLGLGVPPPHATWGNIIAGGRSALADAWWVTTLPGLALVATVILFNLLGDGVRRAFSEPAGSKSAAAG